MAAPIYVYRNPIMANYAYICTNDLDEASAETAIKTAVIACFKDKLVVEKASFRHDGPTWFVTAPGTALNESEARMAMMPPGEDFGFVVSLLDPGTGHGERKGLAFRRPFNHWASWAQSCVIEQLSEQLDKPHLYDADDIRHPPGTNVYRTKPTYEAWIKRNLDPDNQEDMEWAERYFGDRCPKGFWT